MLERPIESGCIYSLTFRNELDRFIDLRVETGTPPRGPTLITISMNGPDSGIENTITKGEARRLRDALNSIMPVQDAELTTGDPKYKVSPEAEQRARIPRLALELIEDRQIKHMANRFLGWKLPQEFRPDAGISFDPPQRHEPTGTNLFDAAQAEAMVRYMTEGLPGTPPPPPEKTSLPEAPREVDEAIIEEICNEVENCTLPSSIMTTGQVIRYRMYEVGRRVFDEILSSPPQRQKMTEAEAQELLASQMVAHGYGSGWVDWIFADKPPGLDAAENAYRRMLVVAIATIRRAANGEGK